MKCRMNPQNNGGNEQPMNQAQTNGQAYFAQPPTNPQNYTGQDNPYQQCSNNGYQSNYPSYNNNRNFTEANYSTTSNAFLAPLVRQSPLLNEDENDELGKITNRDRAMQIMNFNKLRYGKCTPMDIDMVLDVKTNGYVFGEIKYFPDEANEQICNGIINPEDKIKLGERITLMGITDGLQDGGRAACVLLIDSETANPHNDVDVSNAIVLTVYFNHRWRTCRYRNTVRFHTDLFWNAVLTRSDWGNWLDWYYDNCI